MTLISDGSMLDNSSMLPDSVTLNMSGKSCRLLICPFVISSAMSLKVISPYCCTEPLIRTVFGSILMTVDIESESCTSKLKLEVTFSKSVFSVFRLLSPSRILPLPETVVVGGSTTISPTRVYPSDMFICTAGTIGTSLCSISPVSTTMWSGEKRFVWTLFSPSSPFLISSELML